MRGALRPDGVVGPAVVADRSEAGTAGHWEGSGHHAHFGGLALSNVGTGNGWRDCRHLVSALGEREVDRPFCERACRMLVLVTCVGVTTNLPYISSFWAFVSGTLSKAPGPLGGAG